MIKKLQIAIVGGTGYTGVELLRLLSKHPYVELKMITSRSEAGKKLDEMFPSLRGFYDLAFEEPEISRLKQCDLVFFATPNGVAMNQVAELLDAGVKIIDLAADFRIKDIDTWQHWYGMTHQCPDIVAQAVYGLPELYRNEIKKAQIVANPGCYATAIQLGFLPLIEKKCIDISHLIANGASGVSGAGRGAIVSNIYSEINDSYKSYAAQGHRHLPEIKQQLEQVAQEKVNLTFVPHLIPMTRGIHATLYAKLTHQSSIEDIHQLFQKRYKNEPFVDILPLASHPETRSVKSSNFCRIALFKPQDDDMLVILVVIDNLVKGASGQALQNMNIMLGFDEKTALDSAAILP